MFSSTMKDSTDGLPYLDTAEGLGRIGGNKVLFNRLLDTFLKDTNWQKLCDTLESGNLTEAAAACHAIKGMCANLSMKALAAKAAELEVSLKAGNKNDALFESMREIREGTLAAIEQVKAS